MTPSDAFNRALLSLNAAALDDALWPATAALIDEACGLTGNNLLVGQHDAEGARLYFSRFCYRGERRLDLEKTYLTVYYPGDERVPRFRALPDSELVHVTSLYTDAELRTSPTYNEALVMCGGQDALNVRLDGPDGSNIGWELVGSAYPQGWESAQIDMIARLLPHVRQFFRVRNALYRAGALGASNTQLLGNTRVGAVYVDWRGRILEGNDRALDILRQAAGLFEQDGFLHARLPADNTRLQKLLASALPTLGTPALSGSMTVRRPGGATRLALHVNPVPPDHGTDGNGPIAALVLIVEPGHLPNIDLELVAAALGLTPSESMVAIMLAEGRNVREIAAVAGRQVSTVQYHVKRIHGKLGVSTRAELVRLVLSLAGGSVG